MRRRCWKWPVLAVAVASLAGAPGALAQTQPPPEQPPPEQPPTTGPLPPDLVLSGRDVRLNRAGYAHSKVGCRSRGGASDDFCLGTLTLRLGEALTVKVGRKNRHLAQGVKLGVASFRLTVGDVALLTFHLTPLAQRAVRQAGEVSVQLIGGWVTGNGGRDVTKRSVTLYFPKQAPQV